MAEDKESCLKNLENVIELETGIPALNLGLIRVENDTIYYRPVSAYTPQILVIALGLQILKEVFKCGYQVKLENYYLRDEINVRLEMIMNGLS
ncbi:hypothetical protein [Saccharolobus sp. A20]|uniref:hypothetical protein n=1 Tax=Saccharolobus sp. A20 TaxID=1891280 RepID=UPI001E479B9F|nr:hypothetical protein [Sulfolobus sp. A20]